MPTALDRVQVLLQPDEYAELSMLAKEDRRSLAAMAAVLINEAIKARIREGTFSPSEDDPAYANAKRRQVARMLGKKTESEEKSLEQVMDEMGTVSARKVDPSTPTVNEALSGLSEYVNEDGKIDILKPTKDRMPKASNKKAAI